MKKEALVLQKEYQPKLRNGINIAVDLINKVQQDKKDGDVDIRIKIAPNTVEDEVNAVWEDGMDKKEELRYPGVQICSNANLDRINAIKEAKKKLVHPPKPQDALKKIEKGKKMKGNIKNITPSHVERRKKALNELLQIREIESKRCFKPKDKVNFSTLDPKIKRAYETHENEIKNVQKSIAACQDFLDIVDKMSDNEKSEIFPLFVNDGESYKWT